MGRALQQEYGQEPQCILTMPLLEGLDGVEKMSKSKGNYIGITEPANTMFAKLLSISDALMWRYFTLLSFRPEAEIAALKREVEAGRNPKDAKVLLAREITARFHSAAAADAAEADFQRRAERRRARRHAARWRWPARRWPSAPCSSRPGWCLPPARRCAWSNRAACASTAAWSATRA